MTSNSIRSFAFGILISAGVCGLVYYMESNEDTSEKIETPSVGEMKEALEVNGYIIHSAEEWDKQVSNPQSEDGEQQKPPGEKVIYRTMISVPSGMTSIDVGEVLEQTKMIEDGFAFSKEVEKRGLSGNLKPGIYEVSSEMSLDEMISTIFK
jgi:hypothetical protein